MEKCGITEALGALKGVGLGAAFAAAAAKSLQSHPTLCDPIDGSPPGSPVPGILQAGVLEWGAVAFSTSAAECSTNHSFYRLWVFAHHFVPPPTPVCPSQCSERCS